MWAINFKWAWLFSFFIFSGFKCEEEEPNYFNLKIESPPSNYKDAFYMLSIDEYYDEKFLKIKTGENTIRKMWNARFFDFRILDRSCNDNYGTIIDEHSLEFKFSGRPFMELLELKFPEAKNFNKILVDLRDKNCSFGFEPGQRVNLQKAPFIFPVRPDTFNRIYITIDDVVVFDDSLYIGTEKVIKEIK